MIYITYSSVFFRPVARFGLAVQNTFLGKQDFCFYYMF